MCQRRRGVPSPKLLNACWRLTTGPAASSAPQDDRSRSSGDVRLILSPSHGSRGPRVSPGLRLRPFMPSCGEPPRSGHRPVIADPKQAVYDLNLLRDAPAGHECARQGGVGKVDRHRIVQDAASPRWSHRPPISTAIRVQPCRDLIEPAAESLRRNADPDPDRKPALGLSGRLSGGPQATRLKA
jgi:hypothetical protein